VSSYASSCVDTDSTTNEKCYDKAYSLSYIGSSTIDRVNKCMRESFGSGVGANDNLGVLNSDNSKLKSELELKDEMHVDHYPALYVNKERYTVKRLFAKRLYNSLNREALETELSL